MDDTPKTSQAAKAVGSLACQWKTGTLDAVQFEHAAQAQFDALAATERECNCVHEALHDGYTVYSQLTDAEKKFTSVDNASAVLDAFKRVLLANKQVSNARARIKD